MINPNADPEAKTIKKITLILESVKVYQCNKYLTIYSHILCKPHCEFTTRACIGFQITDLYFSHGRQHDLTCGEEAPVRVEREACDGGGRLQLEDVLRPVAERVAELARPHPQPRLPAPLELLVLGGHDVHLQSPAFLPSIKAGAFAGRRPILGNHAYLPYISVFNSVSNVKAIVSRNFQRGEGPSCRGLLSHCKTSVLAEVRFPLYHLSRASPR